MFCRGPSFLARPLNETDRSTFNVFFHSNRLSEARQNTGQGAAAPSGRGGSRRPKEWFVHIMFLNGCQEVSAPHAPKRTGPPSPCAGPAARRRVRPGAGVISQSPHAFGRARELRPARRRLSFPAPSEPPPRRPEAGVSRFGRLPSPSFRPERSTGPWRRETLHPRRFCPGTVPERFLPFDRFTASCFAAHGALVEMTYGGRVERCPGYNKRAA